MSEKLRVAIVDDTPDMRLLVRLSLELDPFVDVVAEAEDGRGAIDVARRLRPDVMLLDLAMPVMDGMQALPQVVSASPGTAVLVLSGFAASTMAEDAVAAGARGYLQKGLGAEELCERVWEASGRERPRPELDEVFALPSEPEATEQPSSPPAAVAAAAAPDGLVVLATAPGAPASHWSVLYLNPAARALLGAEDATRLEELAPGLGEVVTDLLADGDDAVAELTTSGGRLTVRTRRVGGEVVVVVAPDADSERARAADAEVDRLRAAIARTAHELRSPVGVIVGLSDAVQRSAGRLTDAQREDMRSGLRRQAEILRRVTADLDTAVHVERGTLVVELEEVDAAEVARQCLGLTPDETPVEVYADPDVVAHADPSRLTQIITNLLSNARKYAEPPFELHVTRSGDRVSLTLADCGDGVPEDFRPLLFEEFTRAGTDAQGTGLGLYVVQTLAEAQGGEVEYRPRHGGGSLFTVRLAAV